MPGTCSRSRQTARVDRGCSTIATSGPKAFILNDPAITTADLGKRVSGPNITASAPATSETYVVDVRNPGQAIISHPATAAASGFSVEVWSDRYLRSYTQKLWMRVMRK